MPKRKKTVRSSSAPPFGKYTYIVLFLLGAFIGVASLLLAAANFGISMFYSYFEVPLIIILNLIPPIIIIFLVFFLSGRAWIAFSVTSIVVFGMSLINFFKIQVRNDPFVSSDFQFVSEAQNIVSKYPLTIDFRVIIVIIAFIVGLIISIFLLRRPLKVPATRIIGAISALALSSILYFAVYSDSDIYEYISTKFDIVIWSESQTFISKGFVYPFIHSMSDAKVSPPPGYKKATAASMLTEYEYNNIPEDQKIDIISIMLESYADLSKFDEIDINSDVYAPLHVLQMESYSGTVIPNVFAGGTIDTERSFLTGYFNLEKITTHLNSYVRYFSEQGYYTEGLHSGSNWFYGRASANKYLGFDNYYFLQDYENGDMIDVFLFSEIENLYENRDTSTPYFAYHLSYQNHGSYDSELTENEPQLNPNGMSDASYNILNNYLAGIAETTQILYDFVEGFRDSDDPIIIIVFGDHMPWLGNANSVYEELGINVDANTDEGFYNLYSTPYIIWANDPAREIIGNDFDGDGGSLSPAFLMNELFDLCSWGGNEYMKATNELYTRIDIVSTPTGYFRLDGVLAFSVPDSMMGFYNRYRQIEYYWQHNLKS